jgi:hypothetical protein
VSARRPLLSAALAVAAALGLARCFPAPARRAATPTEAARARDRRRMARAAPRVTAPIEADLAPPNVPEAPDDALARPAAFVLSNGLRVAVLRRPGDAPVGVALTCARCGVESPDQPVGAAAAALRLVRVGWSFGGDPRDYGRYLDHGEASLLTATPAERLPAALDRLLQAVHPRDETAPWFRQDGEIVDRFEGHDTDDALRAMIFGRGHPLARPLAGSAEQWGRVLFADAQSFVLMRYGPSQSALGVVGDVDPERLRAELEARFRPWAARELAPVAGAPFHFAAAGPVATVVPSGRSSLVSVALALPTFEANEGSSAALAVFTELLQGYGGTLLRVLRVERGAAYAAEVAVETDRDLTWIEVTAQLRAEAFESSLGALLAAFEGLRARGPTEAEFERARAPRGGGRGGRAARQRPARAPAGQARGDGRRRRARQRPPRAPPRRHPRRRGAGGRPRRCGGSASPCGPTGPRRPPRGRCTGRAFRLVRLEDVL